MLTRCSGAWGTNLHKFVAKLRILANDCCCCCAATISGGTNVHKFVAKLRILMVAYCYLVRCFPSSACKAQTLLGNACATRPCVHPTTHVGRQRPTRMATQRPYFPGRKWAGKDNTVILSLRKTSSGNLSGAKCNFSAATAFLRMADVELPSMACAFSSS